MTRIAVVPGVLALLPEYAAQQDPVPELRAACLAAVAWLGPDPVVLADAQGERVARALMSVVEEGRQARLETTHGTGGFETVASATSSTTGYLVVANGTARRSRSSPGPYDDRARPFDDVLAKALLTPDPEALRALDPDLARELWASTGALTGLADLLVGGESVTVDYDDAPYGVQYWVVRYTW